VSEKNEILRILTVAIFTVSRAFEHALKSAFRVTEKQANWSILLTYT